MTKTTEETTLTPPLQSKGKSRLTFGVLGCVLLAGIAVFMVYRYLPVVTVYEETAFTARDVRDMYKVEKQIADVVGVTVVHSKQDVLYNLVLTAAQWHILKNNGITIDREKSVQAVEEKTQMKGLFRRFRETLGEERYYTLFIRPIVVREVFQRFFESTNPDRLLAQQILVAAQQDGIGRDIQGQTPRQMFIPKNDANADFIRTMTDFLAASDTDAVFDRVVSLGNGFLVIAPKEVREDGLVVIGYLVAQRTFQEYIKSMLPTIPIKFPFLSWYSSKDLVRSDGLFSHLMK